MNTKTIRFIKENIPYLEPGENFKKGEVRSIPGWRRNYWVKRGYAENIQK